MPQRPVPNYWKERVKEHLADNRKATAKEIIEKLETEAEVLRTNESCHFVELSRQCPSTRSIARIKQEEWQQLTEKEKAEYGQFRFPESMEAGVIPWEASASCLTLLAMMDKDTNGRVRPTVNIARWFWRLTLATPGLHAGTRYAIAVTLATHRGAGQPLPEGLEMWLAYSPWTKARKEDYENAVRREQNPVARYIPREMIRPGAGPDSWMALSAMVTGTARMNENREEGERGNKKG
jgi:hypothetical protein